MTICTLALIVVFLPLWRNLLQLTSEAVHYSHIVLIPFVSIYFLFIDRERILANVRYFPAGLILTVAGAVPHLLSGELASALSRNDYLSVMVVSMLAMWIGAFISILGPSAFRAAAFPLLFLLLLAPIPDWALDRIVHFLQKGTSEVVAVIFNFVSTPSFREGDYFTVPGLTIHVAPECSGIRSSIALVITALVAGRMFLRSASSVAILAAIAVPITIFKNGLRIVTLTLLAVHVDEGFLQGGLHTRGGYPFFILALVFLAPFLFWLRRRERPRREGDSGRGPEPSAEPSSPLTAD